MHTAVAIIRILNNYPTMKFIIGNALIIIFILFITRLPQSFSTTEAIQPSLTRLDSKRSSPSVQESAAKALLGRLLPTHLHSFHFKIVSKVFPLNLISIGSGLLVTVIAIRCKEELVFGSLKGKLA